MSVHRCVLSLLSLGLMPAFALAVAPDQPHRPRVFAHYYTWWAGDQAVYPLMPVTGWYRSRLDPNGRPDPPMLFARQFTQARSAGLAGFSFEWPGRKSPETGLILEGPVAFNNHLAPRTRLTYLLCFDSTIWAMEYKKRIKAWYEPIPFDDQLARDFAEEMAFVCTEWARRDPGFKDNYLHIDDRPVVFVYNAHNFGGEWKKALAQAREACEPAGGIFLIGDFEVSPHAMFDERRKKDYPEKAAEYDAVTDYTLFSGHTHFSLYEYIARGQLAAALANGRDLARSSRSRAYYPGIIAQYFKSEAADKPTAGHQRVPGELPDRAFVEDGSAGLVPIYKPADGEERASIRRNSRRVLRALIRNTMHTTPDIVFVTSWNEPYEGTMIEPSRSPNPAGYVMGDDFLEILRHHTGDTTAPCGDLDLDGDVDEQDEQQIAECIARPAQPPSPTCLLADLDVNGKIDSRDQAAFESCRTSAKKQQAR